MQPFTHPELIRIIHGDKVRETLGHHDSESYEWALGETHLLRRAVAHVLVAIGTRLSPPAEREAPPATVVHLPARRANGQVGPDGVAEDENVTDSRPAA